MNQSPIQQARQAMLNKGWKCLQWPLIIRLLGGTVSHATVICTIQIHVLNKTAHTYISGAQPRTDKVFRAPSFHSRNSDYVIQQSFLIKGTDLQVT